MSQKPKVTYFNARGRAEIIRLIFAELEIDYEDIRFELSEKESFMSKLKESGVLAFGQVPLLEIDGLNLVQSQAATAYVATKYGLGGRNAQETALIHMLSLGVEDAKFNLIVAWYAADKRDELMAKYAREDLPKWLTYFETYFKKNNNNNNNNEESFFVGNSLTWIDIAVYDFLFLVNRFPGVIDNFLLLKSFKERIESRPKIAAWIAKRPVTEL
eukprot:TRINITY_DN1546_c0_g4_i1.p1 TRINITY_DN1546_c0_g4~~TRINITY_DN1546_c0_g4_i1.p1  ORF type:complete len:215 (+),score=95.43 TRINITY_DN1546_c0_g4_i1:84-728(+)